MGDHWGASKRCFGASEMGQLGPSSIAMSRLGALGWGRRGRESGRAKSSRSDELRLFRPLTRLHLESLSAIISTGLIAADWTETGLDNLGMR